MPPTDLVPCYYTGQRRLVEPPAEFRTRAELHNLKSQKVGKFVDSGKVFLFFKVMVQKIQRLWDGPLGCGNLLPFSKPRSTGDKLHYEMPMAGDRTAYARSFRKQLHPSKSLFSQPGIQWANYVRQVSA
jgi:hypothetical protein